MSDAQNETEQEPKGRIMLVDDEKNHRKLLRATLGSKYDYIEVSSGLEAIEMFKTEKFDLVLMDYNMPGLTGTEAISHIKKLDRGIETPIIMVSALSNLQNIIQGIDYGAIEYIVKPFNPDELRAKINAIYKFSKQQQQLAIKQAEIERLKLLQQTVITLSHYVNNAFSSISLSIQIVNTNDPNNVKELIKLVESQINKVLAVIKSIKEMAQNADIKLIEYPGAEYEMLDINETMNNRLSENQLYF